MGRSLIAVWYSIGVKVGGRGIEFVKALPFAVFLFAFLIRLPGIGWGLKNDLHNASYHPDEPVIFGFSRGIVPGQGRFTPGSYNYGTLYLTLLRIASDVTTTYSGGPKVQGEGWSWSNPDRTDWEWVSRCHMAGRILSALAGAGTALAVFYIGRRSFGNAAGGLAGAVIAVAPGFVLHSRFQTVDALATFLLACSLYFAVRIASPPNPSEIENQKSKIENVLRDSLWCGFFAGLSAGTKYTGILALFALAAALLLTRPKGFGKALGAGLLAAALAFVLATPGVLLDTQQFVRDFTYEMHHTSTGHGLVFEGTPNGFVYNIGNLFLGIDPLLVLLGLAGLVYAAYKRRPWAVVMLAFWLPYYVLTGRAEVKFLRYSFPLYIGIAAGTGYAMVAAHRRGGWVRLGVGIGILGLGGLGGGGLASTVATSVNMMGEDPRDAAARYLRSTGGRVGLVNGPWFWSPPLYPDSAAPLSVRPAVRLRQMEAQAAPPIDVVANPDGSVTPWDPRLVADLHPDRIAFSSFEFMPVFRLRGSKGLDPSVQPDVDRSTQFLDLLDKSYLLDRQFGSPRRSLIPEWMMPEDLLYSEPLLWVWKRK